MKNIDKYLTAYERDDAFKSFCENHRLAGHGCDTSCPLYHKDGDCHFSWLELEEKTEDVEDAQ